MDQLLLTAEEAGKLLHIGRTTVFALIRDGELHSVRIGRSRRIRRTELDRYIQTLALDARPPRASLHRANEGPVPIRSRRHRRPNGNVAQEGLFGAPDIAPKSGAE